MAERLQRSMGIPVRQRLTYRERWDGADKGLIWCWEDGRLQGIASPVIAELAQSGELVSLSWKKGSLQYLATWQGIRGDDLDVLLDGECRLTCSKTKKEFVFKRGAVPDPPEGSAE